MINKKTNENQGTSYMIKCPYCFEKFSHDKVHFRARTLKEAVAGGRAADDFSDDLDSDDEVFNFFDNEEKEDDDKIDKNKSQLFEESVDKIYNNFWQKFSNRPVNKYVRYPVIRPEDTRMIKGSYHRDSDGFVDSVTDVFNETTKERLCPYCHNTLPDTYGKYPIHFIATVGITSSGKTVYLSQLMSHMDEIMGNVGMGTISITDSDAVFKKVNRIKQGEPLPQGTTLRALSEPLFYVIMNKGVRHTLVFYDVAGEHCVNADEMPTYSPFIKNADAIIMVVDPDQFDSVRMDLDDDVLAPKAVLSAMFRVFLGSSSDKNQVPLALAISKSDKLQSILPSNYNMFRKITYNDKNPGFDVKQYRNQMAEVREFLKKSTQGKAIRIILDENYERYGLFAFSALNCELGEEERKNEKGNAVKVMVPVGNPNPLRIEEPLLWILSEWGIVKKINADGNEEADNKSDSKGWIGRLFGR